MYTLAEAWHEINGRPAKRWEGKILCVEAGHTLASQAHRLTEAMGCYIFTLVTQGSLRLRLRGQESMLQADDLFAYTPGFSLQVADASPDYAALCLMADEDFMLDTPSLHRAMRAAYFPLVEQGEPRFRLLPDEAEHLGELLRLGLRYSTPALPHSEKSLRMVYSLFLTALTEAQERSVTAHRLPQATADLFLRFLQLLPAHFTEHHDIAFYADRLCITPTYLSRIVRLASGQTVGAYISRLLLMEAQWLLQSTTLSIAQIADRLHFSETASFTRFFTRLKGLSPKDFRKDSGA